MAVDEDGRGVYTLLVGATDHGSPKQRTTATVISQSSFVYEVFKIILHLHDPRTCIY